MPYKFQSTRLREARPDLIPRSGRITGFNPRACVRRDLGYAAHRRPQTGFNPRACVRRDRDAMLSRLSIQSFNPRACVRRDTRSAPWCVTGTMFQSTRLREARRLPFLRRSRQSLFQSTRLREARPGRTHIGVLDSWFQSTRLREARPSSVQLCGCSNMFQSTRLREARLGLYNPAPAQRKNLRFRECSTSLRTKTERESLPKNKLFISAA